MAMTNSNSISVNPRPPRLIIYLRQEHDGCPGIGSSIDFAGAGHGCDEWKTQAQAA
jgi:hypothetical protein